MFQEKRNGILVLVVKAGDNMNLKFVLNDYVLIWNLLFQASVNPEIHAFKQKLWKNYRKNYQEMYNEQKNLLKDPKNYIPNDDTIYDMLKDTDMYKKLYDETEEFRLSLMQVWDQNKKVITENLKELIRIDVKLYHVLVVHPGLNIVGTEVVKGKKVNTITWGKRDKDASTLEVLINVLSCILKKEFQDYRVEYHDIVDAILELVIDNELYTRLSNESKYLRGDPTLSFLKRQIYPYFLMYLGATKEECLNYMMRDKIAFDLDFYTFEKDLAHVDLYTFIDFCIRNQKKIIKISQLEIL